MSKSAEYQRKQYEKRKKVLETPENREIARLRAHGVTIETFNTLLELQDYRCAICHKTVAEATIDGRKLCIDHDHDCCPGDRSCGKCIRGLLCPSCNVALGMFKDNVGTLLSAIRYLQSYESYELEDSLDIVDVAYLI